MTPEERKMEETDKFVATNGKYLYHYTSTPALINILKSKELWIGKTNMMNDKKESFHFIDLLSSVLYNELAEDAKIRCEQFFIKVNEVMKENYPFAFCLSTLKDDAAQWERYADNAHGACIVFNATNLHHLTLKTHYILNPIFYEFDIKNHYFYKPLKSYFETQEFPRGYDNNEDFLIGNLCSTANLRKHISFRCENEIRLICFQNNDAFARIEFKIINGTMKEVLVLNIEEWCKQDNFTIEDIIDSIIIGPRSNQAHYVLDLKKYLNQLGYCQLANKVCVSACPLK